MSCADFVVIHFRADFVILCEMFESDFVEECSVNVVSCDNDFFFFGKNTMQCWYFVQL